MEIKQESFNIGIEEWVEAKLWEHGVLTKTFWIKGNTVTLDGKRELAELVGGLASSTIDTLWAKVGGTMVSDTSTNSRSGETLSVATSTAYTIAETYSAIFTGNAGLGSGSYYNSIAINIVLTPGSELDFTVKWVFSGAETGFFGDEICASRLGRLGDVYDYPISSVAIYDVGSQEDVTGSSAAVSNNTLTITHAPFSGPELFDGIYYITSYTTGDRFFDKIDGMTIDFEAGTDIYTETRFVFG